VEEPLSSSESSGFETRTPATTRSQIMLEAASELVNPRGYAYQQARVQLRPQGSGPWTYTLYGSDAPESIYQVAQGEADIAAVNPVAPLTLAYRGTGPFKEPLPVRVITTIPSLDWLGFAVKESTGLTSLADVKAKKYPLRVSLRGQADHSIHLFVDEVLKAYDFTLDDIVSWGGTVSRDQGMPYGANRAGRVKSGEVEAIFDEALRRFIDPAMDLGMRFLPLEEPILQKLESVGFRRIVLEKARFPRLPADVPTLSFAGWPIFTRADVDESFIYDYCRALDARKSTIQWQEPGPLPFARMCVDSPEAPLDVPLHPGAERYWREAGYLK
jgi:TRAP-type uncharacterized transport system substrate-binding protein